MPVFISRIEKIYGINRRAIFRLFKEPKKYIKLSYHRNLPLRNGTVMALKALNGLIWHYTATLYLLGEIKGVALQIYLSLTQPSRKRWGRRMGYCDFDGQLYLPCCPFGYSRKPLKFLLLFKQ